MVSRSRKRGRAAAGATGAAATSTGVSAPEPAAPSEPAPAPASSAPAVPEPADPHGAGPEPAGSAAPAGDDDALRRGYARGRARDDAIRASLEPLAPGERPRVVTVAAMIAFAFAIANVVATLTGDDLSSDQGDPTLFAVITTAILVLAGVGMLARKYWAVLGFQVILGLQIVVFSLALLRVQRWWLAILMTIAIGLLGWLFWKLIRAMARLQMPDRESLLPPREP